MAPATTTYPSHWHPLVAFLLRIARALLRKSFSCESGQTVFDNALLNGFRIYPNISFIEGVRLMKILWALCIVFGIVGFVEGIFGVFGAVSAPQQAAGAAMGVAWAVIPYCIVRAIQQMRPQEVVIKKDE